MIEKNKYNTLKRILEQTISLLVCLLLVLSAAVWTGTLLGKDFAAAPTNTDAEKKSALSAVKPTSAQLEAMNLGGMQLAEADTAVWLVTNAQNEALGTIIGSHPHTKDVTGFAGSTPIYIYIDASEKVQAVIADKNDETPEYFKAVVEEGLLNQWNGKDIETALNEKVDVVSGATYSSRAVIGNVRMALQKYRNINEKVAPEPMIGWPKAILALAVMLIALIVSLLKRRKKWMQATVLILNTVVLGFLTSQYLSMTLLLGWAQNGVPFVTALPAVAMLLLTIILNFCGRPHFHCTWVCPYGSLQALAYMLPLPKIKVGPKYFRIMHRIRTIVLMCILVLAWFDLGAATLLAYEPFSVFLLSSASTAVLILASVFVILSIFVPKVWCTALCPMGELLHLGGEGRQKTKK